MEASLDHGRLPRPGGTEHEQRPALVCDGFTLGGKELLNGDRHV
jgi:hypothetical protein